MKFRAFGREGGRRKLQEKLFGGGEGFDLVFILVFFS